MAFPLPAAASVQEGGSSEEIDAGQKVADELLTSRLERLQQIKGWINTDGDMLPFIAKIAGDVEGKYLRKNLLLNVVLSTVFLIAGWLLSTIATPANAGHIFGR